MVARMTGPWRTAPRRSIAFTGVMGLVLLSLLVVGASWTSGTGFGLPSGTAYEQVWSLGDPGAEPAGLPPQATSVREHHVLSLWPPLRGERQAEAAQPALLPSPGHDEAALRDPQQLAHLPTGSRSPPLT
ncbi:unnamed protein product [[Actinomadura] parvosata subsp. kistnae]|nr:unnamed protein product [Actinomadura parvosata subsp. kistnae]